jgi:hypothetical protein
MQYRALAFAHRLSKETQDDKQVIKRAFQLALGRAPTPKETLIFLEAWRTATSDESTLSPKESPLPNSIMRTVRAEKTGEFYTFKEFLPVSKLYKADLDRSQCNARIRGLSHLCLVIFNSNEFAYLD